MQADENTITKILGLIAGEVREAISLSSLSLICAEDVTTLQMGPLISDKWFIVRTIPYLEQRQSERTQQ